MIHMARVEWNRYETGLVTIEEAKSDNKLEISTLSNPWINEEVSGM